MSSEVETACELNDELGYAIESLALPETVRGCVAASTPLAMAVMTSV